MSVDEYVRRNVCEPILFLVPVRVAAGRMTSAAHLQALAGICLFGVAREYPIIRSGIWRRAATLRYKGIGWRDVLVFRLSDRHHSTVEFR